MLESTIKVVDQTTYSILRFSGNERQGHVTEPQKVTDFIVPLGNGKGMSDCKPISMYFKVSGTT